MPSRQAPQWVIWITTDHLRYDHLASNGNGAMRTPALDRLAASGVSFDQCYVQSPVCMPSRCSFMTGLYPTQTQVMRNGQMLPPDFSPTCATAFSAAGYQTAQIGKLHLQPHENHDYDPRPRHTYGFDVFWCTEERGCYNDPWWAWLTHTHPQHADSFRCPRPTDLQRAEQERTPRVIDAPWQASHSGWVVQTARDYLRQRRDTPQFVHLGFYNPHPPLAPTRQAWDAYAGVALPEPVFTEQEWRDKPPPLARLLQARSDWSPDEFRAYRRALAAMVTEADWAIGSLVEFLEQSNMLERTLLVFSSDHGDFAGDHRITHKNTACYDAVMHVPLLLHWPAGLRPQARRINAMVEMVDLLPTLLGLASAPIPSVMAGQSYSEALLDNQPVDGRPDVLALHAGPFAMLRSSTHKYLRFPGNGNEVLYDLVNDPAETRNLAADSTQQPMLLEMRQRLLERVLDASQSPLSRKFHF